MKGLPIEEEQVRCNFIQSITDLLPRLHASFDAKKSVSVGKAFSAGTFCHLEILLEYFRADQGQLFTNGRSVRVGTCSLV